MSLWRRHRASLIGIPFALALALLLSGQRLDLLWETTGPRSPVALDADGWARLTSTADLEVTASWAEASTAYSTGPSVQPTPVTLPDGLTLWRVKLMFRTDPAEPVIGCQVVLTDETGAEHSPGLRGIEPADLDMRPCLPVDTPGPNPDGTLPTDLDGAPLPPRPEQWDRYVSFVLPAERTPQTVRVWFAYPQAAVFPLDPLTRTGSSGPGSG